MGEIIILFTTTKPLTISIFGLRASFNTFKQRYVINSKHWGGSNKNAPIFAYLGAEDAIDSDVINTIVPEYALRFRALQIYIEVNIYIILLDLNLQIRIRTV